MRVIEKWQSVNTENTEMAFRKVVNGGDVELFHSFSCLQFAHFE